MARKRKQKPYLQWSKKQSAAVTAFFMFFFVFCAVCVVYRPSAAASIVDLALPVAGVMGANLAMYGGTSSFEKYIAGKYGDFMKYRAGVNVPEDDDEKDGESEASEETNG